jgi:dUTP pyrophosphatase
VREPLVVQVRRLDQGLPLPSRQHPGDAGLDLYSTADVTLAPGERAVVGTGIAVAIPDGYAGLATPRSGRAAREGLSIVNTPGVVDAGYRGEILAALVNLDPTEKIHIKRGDRIGQLLIVPVVIPELVEVDELPPSQRGAGGHGSTGR